MKYYPYCEESRILKSPTRILKPAAGVLAAALLFTSCGPVLPKVSAPSAMESLGAIAVDKNTSEIVVAD